MPRAARIEAQDHISAVLCYNVRYQNYFTKGKRTMEKGNGKALFPIVVFVVLYLGLGMLFE